MRKKVFVKSNKDSDNILVQMGRQVQDAGLLEPYYTITKVKIKL